MDSHRLKTDPYMGPTGSRKRSGTFESVSQPTKSMICGGMMEIFGYIIGLAIAILFYRDIRKIRDLDRDLEPLGDRIFRLRTESDRILEQAAFQVQELKDATRSQPPNDTPPEGDSETYKPIHFN